MKRIIAFIILAGLVSFGLSTFSQTPIKLGHVNINEIMTALPERDSAQVKLDKETKEIQDTYEEMNVVYNKMLDEYQKGLSTYSDFVKKEKETEILDKQKRIQGYEQNATTSLQQRNLELFQPIYDKIIKAIDKVATDGGFTYILDVSKGTVVFSSKDSQNINQQVIKTLK
jgi:outer membrane protein